VDLSVGLLGGNNWMKTL